MQSEVKGIINGDRIAMERVYNALAPQVFAYAKSYVIDPEQAKEITQDSFVYLWEKRKTLAEDSNLKGYLLRVARNKCLNYFAKLKTQRNYNDYLRDRELRVNYYALQDATAEQLLTAELEQIIRETLESLPEPYREVFELNRTHEMSYADIAEKLGISIKTVEYRMMRTLRIFRKNLAPYLPFIILFWGLRN